MRRRETETCSAKGEAKWDIGIMSGFHEVQEGDQIPIIGLTSGADSVTHFSE